MEARVPIPLRGVNILALPLSTIEGFVLSRVDGSTSLEDISIMSGIDQDKVLGILERLSDLGAVQLSWRTAKAQAGRKEGGSALSAPFGRSSTPVAAKDAPARVAVVPDAHFTCDPPRFTAEELNDSADISLATRTRILHAFHSLEGRNLYQLLGVTRDADRQAIRVAYFELSKLFHPDAYFGRELRSFKPKMETVFKRLTESYEVLGKPKKRREYDEYLAVTEQAQRAQRTLQSIEFTEQDITAMRQAAERYAAGVAQPPSPPVSSLRPPAPAVETPPIQTPSSPAPSQTERRARVRERLRQRLRPMSSQWPPPAAAPVAAPVATPQDAEQRRRGLIQGLRNSLRDSANVSSSPQAQLSTHLGKARHAESSGDILLATNHLQMALGVDPNNAEALTEYERMSKVVARNLADNYEKQAQYEEKTGNWQAAARSWTRVSEGRPDDPHPARSAAEALLKASGDLHMAQKYAQRAVALAGQSAGNLTTLARVYLAAGLKLNALRELEKAARLAPGDEEVANLLQEAR